MMFNRTTDFEALIRRDIKKKYQKEVLSRLKELREFKPTCCSEFLKYDYILFKKWKSEAKIEEDKMRFDYGKYIFKNNPKKSLIIRNFEYYAFNMKYFEV